MIRRQTIVLAKAIGPDLLRDRLGPELALQVLEDAGARCGEDVAVTLVPHCAEHGYGQRSPGMSVHQDDTSNQAAIPTAPATTGVQPGGHYAVPAGPERDRYKLRFGITTPGGRRPASLHRVSEGWVGCWCRCRSQCR